MASDWATDDSDLSTGDDGTPSRRWSGMVGDGGEEGAPLLALHQSLNTPVARKLSALPTRLWIVASLFMLSSLQAVCWNVFSPIFSTVHTVYDWDDEDVEWLANVANIAMLVSLPFTTVIVGTLGIRVPTVLTAWLMVLCTSFRVVPRIYADVTGGSLDTRVIFSLNVVSMAFNGASAAWLSYSGPVLSEIWFPQNQRGTVTAVLTVAPYVGVSLGYIVPPLVVPKGGAGAASLDTMLLAHAICAAAIMLAMTAYFPKAPATAPTRASMVRAELHAKSGGSDTARARSVVADLAHIMFGCRGQGSSAVRVLWVISFVFAIPLGVQAGWGAVLAINLKEVAGIDSIMSGWIGCISTLSGCIGGVVVGALNDRFTGWLKTTILVSYTLASIFFLAFGLLVLQLYMPPPHMLVPLLYATAICGGFFLYCPIPLFYEMAVEETYPRIPAATSSGALSILITVVQIVFLFAPIGKWMNWAMMVVTPVCIMPMLLLSVKYPRTREDRDVKVSRVDAMGIN